MYTTTHCVVNDGGVTVAAAVSGTVASIQTSDQVFDTEVIGTFLRAVLTSLVTHQLEVQQSVQREKDHTIVTQAAISL